MGLRSLGNPLASFLDVFSETVAVPKKPVSVAQFSASGGTFAPDGITPGNGWTYHTFTQPGELILTNVNTTDSSSELEVLVVAGGGGGGVANNTGSDGGGGGGAGNVNTYTGYAISDIGPGPFTITVGTGGATIAGGNSPGSNSISSQVGADSTIVSPTGQLTAKGGGGGGSGPIGGPLGPYGTGGSGGGGGGGGGATPSHYGNAITNTPQPLLSGGGGTIIQRGSIGAGGNTPPYFGGGGGGADGNGNPGTTGTRGRGGSSVYLSDWTGTLLGIPALIPYNGHYGGGGPGGSGGPGDNPATDAPPSPGGSAPTSNTPGSPASNGPRTGGAGGTNTGAGGGAASGAPSPPQPSSPGGAGGPGIVVIRYKV